MKTILRHLCIIVICAWIAYVSLTAFGELWGFVAGVATLVAISFLIYLVVDMFDTSIRKEIKK